MTEPTANGVDIHTGAQEVSRSRVANGGWTDAFCSQRRHLRGGSPDIAFDECVDSESGQGLAAAVEKDVFTKSAARNEGMEFSSGLWP